MININFDEENKTLLIEGAIEKIVHKPLFASFLRSCKGIVASPELVLIPTTKEAVDRRFQSLTKILGKYGVDLGVADELSNTMREIYEDEQRFKFFSQQAESIWHNDIETTAFTEFVKAVSERCPGRTFYRRQLLSAYHLAFSQNACNFSVPGAGKTSVVYAAYAYLNSLVDNTDRYVDHLFIVGPLSSFKAWEDEFKSIFSRAPVSRRLTGAVPKSERRNYLRGIEARGQQVELTLTSYQTLNNQEDEFRIFLTRPNQRVMMVLDEAHNIKRDDGQWASSVLSLGPAAKARVVLTGTPAPNGYEDLSNLFKFLYANRPIIGFSPGTLRAMSEGKLPAGIDKLKDQVRPFYTRIKKSDLNLPPISEHRVAVPMSDSQEQIYRSIERIVVPGLEASRSATSFLVRARLIRLRQAATNPSLLLKPIEDERMLSLASQSAFSASELEITELVKSFQAETQLRRLSVTKNLVEQIISEQGKALIWSGFIENIDLLKRHLEELADFAEVIYGATPLGDEDDNYADLESREAIIDRFHNEGETGILIANPQAIGESISLHKTCHSAIYFDRDFNAGRFIQSMDRIQRYGLEADETTDYYYIISEGSVDEDIDRRLEFKAKRMAELIDSEEIPLFGLAIEGNESQVDILEIIKSYERRKTN